MVLRKFNQIYSQKQVTGLYEESIITLVVFINYKFCEVLDTLEEKFFKIV